MAAMMMAGRSSSSARPRLAPLLNNTQTAIIPTTCRRCNLHVSPVQRLATAAATVLSDEQGEDAIGSRYGAKIPEGQGRQFKEQPLQVRMLLVGSPGSGKGTLSKLLHSSYPSLNNISAGDLLRQNIQRGTELGRRADEYIRRGDLLDDETMMEMVGKEVEAKGTQSWLLDGFPRTSGQAQLLDQALQRQNRPLNLIVNLDVPEEVILKRILDRWVHLPSGRVYNSQYNPPKVAGKDDETGEVLVQRPDDNEETFTSRLRSFHSQTGPMISHYSSSSSNPPLSLALSQSTPTPRHDERVYVSLKGETSKAIWPLLKGVMKWRFALEDVESP